jgi:hypothetical protein
VLRIAAFFYAVRKVWPIVVGIGAGVLIIVMAVGLSLLVLAGTGVGLLARSVCDAAPEVDHVAAQQTDLWRDQPEVVRSSPEDEPIRAGRRSRLTVR